MSRHKYIITTTSTGGSNASLRVDTYLDDVLSDSVTVVFRDVRGSWRTFDNLIKIGYGHAAFNQWTIEILGAIEGYSVGNRINWVYSTTQNITLTEVAKLEHGYLIESGGDYYTIQNGSLVNLGSTLNASLFEDNGLDSLPSWSDYSSLANPSVLCWDATAESSMVATTTGVPNPKNVVTNNIDMTNFAYVYNVQITSDADTLFAVSFDDGTTWWDYENNTWTQALTDSDGSTKSTFESISANAWKEKSNTGHIKFRWRLLDENGYVTRIRIQFTRTSGGVEYLTVVNGAVNLVFDDGN